MTAALALAEHYLTIARDDCDHFERGLWALQSRLLGDLTPDHRWRTELTRDEWRRALAFAEESRTAAFARRAALMSEASPLRLVPRALTPDEARALDVAERHLRIVRGMRRIFLRSLWEAQGRLIAAVATGDVEAADRARTTIAFDRGDLARNPVSAALDARTPLLAAQWQPAPSPRALAPCDDCRAPAGVACGPACPSRVEPPEAP